MTRLERRRTYMKPLRFDARDPRHVAAWNVAWVWAQSHWHYSTALDLVYRAVYGHGLEGPR